MEYLRISRVWPIYPKGDTMWIFDNFVAEAMTLVIIAAIGYWLLSQKNAMLRLVGAMLCLAGLLQLLKSPSVLAAISLAGMIYIVFLAVRAARRAQRERRQVATTLFCARCGHVSHLAICPTCGCRN